MSLFWHLVVLLFIHGSAAQLIERFENDTFKGVLLQDRSVSVVDLESYLGEVEDVYDDLAFRTMCECRRDKNSVCMKDATDSWNTSDHPVSQHNNDLRNMKDAAREFNSIMAQNSSSKFRISAEDITITYDLTIIGYAPRARGLGPAVTTLESFDKKTALRLLLEMVDAQDSVLLGDRHHIKRETLTPL